MVRRVCLLAALLPLLNFVFPAVAFAKGSAIDYFTVEGRYILWPVRFTADLGKHMPLNHDLPLRPPPEPKTSPFVIRGYYISTDPQLPDQQYAYSPLLYWHPANEQAYFYLADGQPNQWFVARTGFNQAFETAAQSAQMRTTGVLISLVAIASLTIVALRRRPQRSRRTLGNPEIVAR